MKKLFVVSLLLLLVAGQTTKAQEEKEFRFTIKTNPLAALGGPFWITIVPITGEYKILFEAKTARKQSVEAGISYLGPSVLLNLNQIVSDSANVSGLKTSGFRAQLAYKFFLTKESAPEGFYVGPHFSYAKAKLVSKDNPDNYFEVSRLNADILLGYQLITSGGFTLNIYTGLGLKKRDYNFNQDSEPIFDFKTGNEVTPNVPIGFTFGYAF